MNKLRKNIVYACMGLTTITTLVYTYIRIVSVFLRNEIKGDEREYLQVFTVFVDSGFSEANIIGNSVIFNLVSFVFHGLGLNKIMSLRATSLFFVVFSILLLIYFINRFYSYLPSIYKKSIIITSVNLMVVLSFWFAGVNDSLIASFMLLFFIVFFNLKKNKKDNNEYKYFCYIGLIMGLMLTTRMMSIVIYPSIILILGNYFYKKRIPIKALSSRLALLLFSFFIIVLSLNYPSLKENGKLSFQKKKISTEGVSWTQLQYLTVICFEKDLVEYGQHCTPEDVVNYLQENGINSLPNSSFEALTFNTSRTIKTTFREFVLLVKPYTRLLGLMFIVSLILFIKGILNKEIGLKKILNNEILLFHFSYTFILTFIIINYIEVRWLMSVLVLIPVLFFTYFYKYIRNNNRNNKLEFLFFCGHFLLLALMNVKFIINNYEFLLLY